MVSSEVVQTGPDHAPVFAAPARWGLRVHAGRLAVEDVALAEIAAAVGTPTYVYGAGEIAARFHALARACRSHPTLIAYAVKANSSQAVLAHLAQLGAGADIVSGGELRRALVAGVPADKIVFSGVGKLDAELDAAIAAGVRAINIESVAELDRVAARARALGRVAAVALRLNPDIDPDTHPYLATGLRESKFGIAMSDGAAVAARARALPELRLVGLACHIGSQILDAAPFLASFERLCGLVRALQADGAPLRQLDLGGGMGIAYAPTDRELDVERLGAALTAAVAPLGLELVLEPGRFLVGTAGVLLTQVIGRKRSGEREFVIVDAAMNDLLRPALYGAYHPIVPVEVAAGERPTLRADVVGPVCECGDFLAENRLIAAAEPGELLAVLSAGAYGMAMASTYNSRPLAAEVMVHGREFAVTRARKTVDQLIAEEQLPAWLAR
ncbi:diaminopimelate decarboxylase [Nannocystis bainbridge]|uniref:Diaminopimelate decarboxylase n=1 Tax=Nannocystis bainbridge TaxID=2995303 RepID=A0ABT5DTK8_9BACT|nr:diaminopimelate decarboxylase [Nannocystis bainbridge]MDC0716955.1 diaminopimelate decarboxylase [Nannocystis bainbridge]